MTPPGSENDERHLKSHEKTKSADVIIGKKNQIMSESQSISIEKSAMSYAILHPAVVDNHLLPSPLQAHDEEEEIYADHAEDSDVSNSIKAPSSSHNSQAILSEYEEKCDKLEKENQSLKEKICNIEMDLEAYYNQIASKELKYMELSEKMEEIEKNQPIVLIKEMKDALAEAANLIQNMQPILQGHHLHQQASAGNVGLPSSAAKSTTGTRMKKLWSDVMVSDSCIRKSLFLLNRSDTCRNRIAALILDDLYTVDELAAMLLSGRKCPGQDRAAKPKLPPDIVTAIHNYMQQVWDERFTTNDEKKKRKKCGPVIGEAD